ncbi:hypothetical protein GCM10028822_31830 [Hymenobacter terrigena]
MKRQKNFSVKLYSTAKGVIGSLLAIAIVFAIAFLGFKFASSKDAALLWALGVLAVGGYLSYQVLKRWVRHEVTMVVRPDQVIMEQVRDGAVTIIPFADLAAYRYESFRGREVLFFKLASGRKVKLVAHDAFGETGDFTGFARAVEQAIETYSEENNAATAIIRQPGFFERPISTIMLVVTTGLFVWFIVKIVRNDLPLHGNMVASFGAYVAYLGAWLAATKRRNQHPD